MLSKEFEQILYKSASAWLGWCWVSHSSNEFWRELVLVDIPLTKKVERGSLTARERPHIRVDFLTVWNSIDKFSKAHPCMYACMHAVQRGILCVKSPQSNAHASFLSSSHLDSSRRSRANMRIHTRIPEVLSKECGTTPCWH